MNPKLVLYSYSACGTCKKAIKWLCDKQIDYQLIDITITPPSKEKITDAINQLGSRKALFNTSGLSYRKLGAKNVQSMSDQQVIEALATDGKLIKRPFLISAQGHILVGFKQEVWEEVLLGKS